MYRLGKGILCCDNKYLNIAGCMQTKWRDLKIFMHLIFSVYSELDEKLTAYYTV